MLVERRRSELCSRKQPCTRPVIIPYVFSRPSLDTTHQQFNVITAYHHAYERRSAPQAQPRQSLPRTAPIPTPIPLPRHFHAIDSHRNSLVPSTQSSTGSLLPGQISFHGQSPYCSARAGLRHRRDSPRYCDSCPRLGCSRDSRTDCGGRRWPGWRRGRRRSTIRRGRWG